MSKILLPTGGVVYISIYNKLRSKNSCRRLKIFLFNVLTIYKAIAKYKVCTYRNIRLI